MNKLKFNAGAVLFALSAAALATTWYSGYKVPGNYEADADADWAGANSVMKVNQSQINTGSMKPGDTVVMQYQDGTIVKFIMGQPITCQGGKCVWSTHPFDPNATPQPVQGHFVPGGRSPNNLMVWQTETLPDIPLYPNLSAGDINWSITVTSDGNSETYGGTTPGAGSGTGGGGGGGTGDGPACKDDCDDGDHL